LPYDVAVMKQYDKCAKLLRPDDEDTSKTAAEQTKDRRGSSEIIEIDVGYKEDESSSKKSSSENKSSSNGEVQQDTNADDQTNSSGKDSAKHNDVENEDKDGIVSDDGKNKESEEESEQNDEKTTDIVQEEPENSSVVPCEEIGIAASGLGDELTNEDRQNKHDESRKERVESLKEEEKVTNEDGKTETRKKKRKQKDNVVVDSEESGKQETKQKSQRDAERAPRSPSKNRQTSPSRTADETGDQSTTTKTNEQRKDRRRKPAAEKSPQNTRRSKVERESTPPQSPRKEAPPSTIREQVRVFEMRRLVSRELEKTRRYQLQLGRAGAPVSGTTDRQLTRLIAEDFNEKAHRGYHIDDNQVNDLDSMKTYLQGKTLVTHCAPCQIQFYSWFGVITVAVINKTLATFARDVAKILLMGTGEGHVGWMYVPEDGYAPPEDKFNVFCENNAIWCMRYYYYYYIHFQNFYTSEYIHSPLSLIWRSPASRPLVTYCTLLRP